MPRHTMQHSAAASHHRTAARTCHMARRRGGPSKAAGSRQAAPFGPSALSAVAANWARAWEGPMDRRWTDPQPGRFEKLFYHFVSSFDGGASLGWSLLLVLRHTQSRWRLGRRLRRPPGSSVRPGGAAGGGACRRSGRRAGWSAARRSARAASAWPGMRSAGSGGARPRSAGEWFTSVFASQREAAAAVVAW
jgi:hypothetical protein